ncbi:hypothetical protein pb186bvf_001727 [Paramecium bursaria]
MEEEFGKFSKRNILSLNLFVFSIFTLFDCIISLFGFEMLKIQQYISIDKYIQ